MGLSNEILSLEMNLNQSDLLVGIRPCPPTVPMGGSRVDRGTLRKVSLPQLQIIIPRLSIAAPGLSMCAPNNGQSRFDSERLLQHLCGRSLTVEQPLFRKGAY